MSEQTDRPRLQIVYSKPRPSEIKTLFSSENVGPQGALFPSTRFGVVVFVSFLQIEDQDFFEVMEYAQPAVILDLRIAPRFDLGRLNRRLAFQLFEQVKANYIDTGSLVTTGDSHDAALNAIREILASSRFDLSRPIVCLVGQPGSSVASDKEVLDLLAETGKKASEVVSVPNFAR